MYLDIYDVETICSGSRRPLFVIYGHQVSTPLNSSVGCGSSIFCGPALFIW
jgi:hypothetical protein